MSKKVSQKTTVIWGHFNGKGEKMRSKNQFGRSMIEMLGVLAIIGVLSVGGIAGYSKAMMKFKINKTIQQVAQVATTVRTLYAQQKDFNGLTTSGYGTSSSLDDIILPDSIQKVSVRHGSTTSYQYVNDFGGGFEVGVRGDWDGRAWNANSFYIDITSLPTEACIALGSTDWGSAGASGIIGVSVGYFYSVAADWIYQGCKGGDKYQNGYSYYACADALPISPAKIAEACKYYDESSGDVSIVFSK